MKRLLILLVALLAAAPGCHKKTTKKTVTTEAVGMKDREPELKQKKESIFLDEDIDKFALREEEKVAEPVIEEVAKPEPVEINTFAPADIKNNREAVTLFEEEEAADRALDAKRNADQRKSGLKTIYFDFDKFVIRKDQVDALNRDLELIKKITEEGKTIVVEGHACRSAGSDAYNMILSEKRARSTADWLIKHGINKKYIKVVGRGYELCIVTEGSREEQAPNRRVEFYILK